METNTIPSPGPDGEDAAPSKNPVATGDSGMTKTRPANLRIQPEPPCCPEIETVLRQTEERFRLVVEASPNAMVMVDSGSVIVLVNSQAERLFSYSRSEMLGQPLEMLVPARFKARHPKHVQEFFATPESRPMGAGRDLFAVAKDGREIPVEIGLNPIQTADGSFVLASIIDISERKKADEAYARYAALVESSNDAIVGKTLEGIVTSWNRGAERLFGYRSDEMVGRSIEILVPGDRRGEELDILSRIRSGETVGRYETKRRRKNGEIVDVSLTISPVRDPSGRIVGASKIAQDITERKKADALLAQQKQALEARVAERTFELEASEAVLRQFIAHAPAAIAMLDTEMRYLQASQRWLADYRLGSQNIIGRSHYEIFPYIPGRWKEIHRRVLAGAVESCAEDPFPRSDGTVEWLQWEARPWRKAGGEIGGIMFFTQVITERKRASEALRVSEERFRNAVEYSAIGFAQVALDGRWIEVNRALCEIVGYERDQLLKITFQDITDPSDLEADLTNVRDLLAGRITHYHMEKRYRHKRGAIVWVLLSVSLVRNAAGQPLFFVSQVQDITAAKEAERRRSALLDATRVLAESAGLDEAATGILRAICENLGWEFGTVWRVRSSDLPLECIAIWPEANDADRPFREATASTPFYRGVGLPGAIWRDAQPMWVDDFAQRADFPRSGAASACGFHASFGFPITLRRMVLGVIEFFRKTVRPPDLGAFETFSSLGVQMGQFMERRRAELALHETLTLQRAILEGSAYAIVAADPSGKIRSFNRAAENLLGYSANEVVGKESLAVWHDASELVRRANVLTLELDVPVEPGLDALVAKARIGFPDENEWTLIRKNGGRFPASVSMTSLRDNNETTGFLGIIADISERKLAQEKLKNVIGELERSNRELEQFAYVASHDLQEPLRAVAGCVQILGRRYSDKLDVQGKELIGHSVEGAQRMQQLIHDLLALSRVGSHGAQFSMVDSGLACRSAVRNLAVAIAESGAIINMDGLPTVFADSIQLTQLLQNLIGNAIKYRSAKPPEILIEATRSGVWWQFSVRDNGIGIEPQYSERIFGVFQRLHSRAEYPGTGIGLAICKKIVERHGGRIWVESVSGAGSVFHFTLPAESMKKSA